MVQIFVVAYLVISLPVALLLWSVLVVAKRADDKSSEYTSFEHDQFFESKSESINFY
jgi:hypothetical protein